MPTDISELGKGRYRIAPKGKGKTTLPDGTPLCAKQLKTLKLLAAHPEGLAYEEIIWRTRSWHEVIRDFIIGRTKDYYKRT